MENKLINKNNYSKDQGGQVILIVMLISALVLTLGLSAAKQATVETKIDTDEELLKKAFNTAESGVDYYLATNKLQYTTPDTGVLTVANVSTTNIGNGTTLSSDGVVTEGNTEVFWLMGHKADGSLDPTVYFSGSAINVCSPSADGNFKIDYFYKNGVNYGVSRSYQSTTNKCVTVAMGGGSNLPVLLAVTPVGFQTNISLSGVGGGNFPVQGEEISSLGQVGSVNTTVRVINKYQVPIFMLEGITSEGNVLSQ